MPPGIMLPADLGSQIFGPALRCGRWGYTCERLWCGQPCARTDGHGKHDHWCADHLDT
jgi:hypothetical protein